MSGTYDDLPTENLRFEEAPPEVLDAMTHADDDSPTNALLDIVGQALGDIQTLTVQLERSNNLIVGMDKILTALNFPEYVPEDVQQFININNRLLNTIAETYVPDVAESGEQE